MRTVENAPGQIQIEIGGLCAHIHSNSKELIKGLSARYSEFFSECDADMIIDVELNEAAPIREGIEGLQITENKEGICIDHRHFTGFLRHSSEYNKIWLRRINVAYLQFFIRCCYGHLAAGHSGLIVHASAIVEAGKSFIFVGPSGVGKTTIAKLSSDKIVLSDDGVLIRILNGAFEAFGTPFGLGTSSDSVLSVDIAGKNMSAPLQTIFLLQRGRDIRFRKLQPHEALTGIFFQSQMCRFFGLKKPTALVRSSFELCTELVKHVACYEMSFTPRRLFWEEARKL